MLKNKSAPSEFSSEEKRIARLLSIENNLSSEAQTPQIKALTCVLGIESLEAQMLRANLLSEEQKAALEQAKSYYRARAYEDQSQEDIENISRESEELVNSPSEQIRRGLSCLRDMI